MSDAPPDPISEPVPPSGELAPALRPLTDEEAAEYMRHRLRLLPKEVGAVLIAFGVTGLILPGPFGTPLVLAGGLVLAPRWFHRTEKWVQRRFPSLHREGRRRVDRFLDDFEKRYPRHGHE